MDNTVTKCLKVCEEKECSSIAFPALGAGNLHYPALVVAKVMINAVHNYFQANRTTTCIKEVNFVIFMNETYNEFKSYLSKLSGDLLELLSPPTSASYISLHHSAPSYGVPSLPPSDSLLGTFKAGDIGVEVIHDDISFDDSDAIVSPTQSDLQPLTGTVSNAISDKAGSIMQQNCQIYIRKHKQLEEGIIFVTQAAGKLRCKVVFHIIAPKTKKMLSEAVTSCLNEAEHKELSSIAIPAIGTGETTLNPNVVGQLTCEAIIEFGQNFPMFLKQVRIVLHQESSYQIFLQKFIHISNEYTARSQPNVFVQCRHVKSTAATEFTGARVITKPVIPSFLQASSVQIEVYAMSQEAVLKTEDSLLDIIHEQFKSFAVNNPIVSTLKPQQVSQLMQKAAKLHLVIEVERELSRIQIRGRKDHIQLLKNVIFEMFHEIDKKAIETLATEKEAKLKRETKLQLERKEAQLRKEASEKEERLKKEAKMKEERLKREANEKEAWLAREAEFKLQAKEAQLKREAGEKEINLKRAAAMELQEKELLLKREANEKEAQLKKETSEKEAWLKREAKIQLEEKEAKLKREASEKEARLKREAKIQLEEKEAKLKREASEKETQLKKEASKKEAQLKREASEKEAHLKREAKLQLEEKEAKLKREASEKEIQFKKEAALQKEVKWEYLVNDNNYTDYDLDINYKIEEAYKLYKAQKLPAVFTYTKQSQEYKIYFDRNPIQQENSSNKSVINIRRIDIKEMINMARRGEKLIIIV